MKKLLIITLLSITASSQAMFKGLSVQSARLATAAAFNLKSARPLCHTAKVSDKYEDFEKVLLETQKYFSNFHDLNKVQNDIIESMRKSFLISRDIYIHRDNSKKLMVSISRLNKETKHLNILQEKHENIKAKFKN